MQIFRSLRTLPDWVPKAFWLWWNEDVSIHSIRLIKPETFAVDHSHQISLYTVSSRCNVTGITHARSLFPVVLNWKSRRWCPLRRMTPFRSSNMCKCKISGWPYASLDHSLWASTPDVTCKLCFEMQTETNNTATPIPSNMLRLDVMTSTEHFAVNTVAPHLVKCIAFHIGRVHREQYMYCL